MPPAEVLAHGAAAVRILAGTIFGLPLALIALLTAVAGRSRESRRLLRASCWLGWCAVVWNLGWCTLILAKDGLPFEFSPHWYYSWSEIAEYVVFFGPAILLSVSVVLISRRSTFAPRLSPASVCLECGYNLTDLTVARCPECGTPFDPALLHKSGPTNGCSVKQ